MPNQSPVKYRYYPRLSSVISEDDIPDILGFIKDGIVSLLDRIYFKDLQSSKSLKGDAAFYSLSIVSKRIQIEIPGTGISLVLNPDYNGNDSNISAFPITVEYQWRVLAYLRIFSLGDFSFNPLQVFDILLNILNVSEEQAISNFLDTFVEPVDQDVSLLLQFVKDLNEANPDWSSPIPLPTDTTTVTQVVQEIFSRAGKYASLVSFGSYILSDDVDETTIKLKVYFSSFLPQDIDAFIKEVVIPKFRATLLLSAAVEFPRSILVPVDPITLDPLPEDSNGDPKVLLSFAEALFYADTERGFGYNMDIVLNTNYPAQIGNTGFIIDIHNLKIDLSTKENIAEADADGRPKEFMGVYMEYTEIFLPKKWFKKSQGQTIGISANHLLIGTGGLSGNIAVRATYKTELVNNTTKVVSYFSEYFNFIYPIQVRSILDPAVTTVGSHGDLLIFINDLFSPVQLKFEYPLLLIVNSTGETKVFRNETEYYDFLKTLNTTIDPFNPNTFLWFNLGKTEEKSWKLGFQQFDIDFHQGQIVHSSLHAALEIKKFTTVDDNDLPTDETLYIDIKGEWESKENFKLSAAFLPSGLKMNLFNFLNFYLQNVEIGKKDDDFYIMADTKITFPKDSFGAKILKDGIDLPAIRYYASGKFEIAGGNATIPISLSLDIGPIKMSVTAIHFGTIQREWGGSMRSYNYIGFDGGININPLGLDVRGNGVKFYYTNDNDEHGGQGDSYFHISTIEVDLVIPGTASTASAMAIIKGALTIPEPGVSSEYRGKISIQLPKMNMYGSAEMAFDPKYPGFYIDASVELPVAIPLGSFGIFGFRGLLGYRYIAHKSAIGMTDDDTWYDYYVYPERGIHMDKFVGPQFTQKYGFPFSVGIGASLATLDGRLASLRAMVLLSLPSMFAIDAGLTIISERLGLTEDDPRVPPFYAFVIVGNDSLEIGAGGNFQLNRKDGSFIDIKAEVQMGFFFKNQRPWYVNFGTREKPITASLFKDSINIKAQAYLMIAAKGIEAGARVDFNLNLIILKVWAAIEVGGKVSFERPQTGGYIYVEGGAEINLYIIKVSLFISIYFRVELIIPFLILAEFKLELKVKLFIVKITLKVHLTIKWEKEKNTDTSGIPPITYETDNPALVDYPKEARLESAVKGINMLTSEEFILKPLLPINQLPDPAFVENNSPYIPLDTYVDIKIEKGMIPGSLVDQKIGGHTTGASGYLDLIPPEKNQPGGHVIRQVQHKYIIEDIKINIAKGSGWQEYNPYRAVVTDAELPLLPNINSFKIGFWQKTNEQYDTIRILASTPFSFLDGGQPGWFIPEQYGITASSLFCTEHTETWHDSNVLDKPVGTIYLQPTMYPNEYINGAYYNILGAVADDDYMSVSNISNHHNFPKSLKINNGNSLIIILPQSSAKVKLLLSTMASDVTIKYYKDVFSNAIYQQYELVTELTKSKAELSNVVLYQSTDFSDKYVSKIEIIPHNADQVQIDVINTQINQIWQNAIANTTGEVTSVILSPSEKVLYDSLLDQLEELKIGGCTSSQCNELDFEVLRIQNNYSGIVDFYGSYVSNNWIAYQVAYMQITGESAPYVDFNIHSVIFLFLPNNHFNQFILHNTLISKITDKADGINICYSSDYPKELMNKAVVIKVNKINSKPISLQFTPVCGCDENTEPCKKIDELCSFLSEVTYNLNACISYNVPDPLHDNWKCFDVYIRTLYNFDKEHAYYGLISESPGYVRDLIKDLEAYPNSDGATLYGALQLVQKIYDIIYKLGDCGCNEEGEYTSNCYTLLQQVSWFTAQDYEYQQTIPSQAAVQEDAQLMMEAMAKVIQPIWRPNSVYCVNLKLKDEVNGDTPHIFDYYFGFKTAGPIGHFEKKNTDYLELLKDENGIPLVPEQRRKPEEYPITSLKSYIDMRRSYPNADGSLLMSKPLFYGNQECEIRLFFTKAYIYNMLKTWEEAQGLKKLKGNINIVIKDPITDVIIPYPLPQDWTQHETVPETAEEWINDDDPNLPLSIQQMINYVNHVNNTPGSIFCSIELGDPVKPKSYSYSVVLTNLNPEKLYTAIVYNAFDENEDESFAPQLDGNGKIIYEENQKVHEFVFKTSRYQNFKEQVESYKLKDYDDKNVLIEERDAVYQLKVNVSQQQLNDVYTLVSGGAENTYLLSLVNTYSEVFDRAFEGVLGIKPLDPPNTTEFVKIINTNNDIVALLVRNPEPFNDPKIPLSEIRNTLEVVNALGVANDDFNVLYSKDYSQMIIMHKNKKITNDKLSFKFIYKTWDGSGYEEKPAVMVNDIQLITN